MHFVYDTVQELYLSHESDLHTMLYVQGLYDVGIKRERNCLERSRMLVCVSYEKDCRSPIVEGLK
jgi:hypothetical protein